MKWIKTVGTPSETICSNLFNSVEVFTLGLYGNQEKQSMKFSNHCTLMLKIKYLLWVKSLDWIGWDTFFIFWKSDSGYKPCVCSLSSYNTENILVLIFTILCCRRESFIVHEIEGRTMAECVGGDEWGAVSYMSMVNISWWDFFFNAQWFDSCSCYSDITCKPNYSPLIYQRIRRSEEVERPNDLAKPSSTDLCSSLPFSSSLESVSGYIPVLCMLLQSPRVLADTEGMVLRTVVFRDWVCPMETLLLSLQFCSVAVRSHASRGLRGWLKSLQRECYSESFLLSGPLHGFLGIYPTAFSPRRV